MFALLFIVPSVQDSQNVGKSFFKGFTLGAATLLIIVVRDTAVLGPVAELSALPSLETVRLIDLGHAITRVEIIYSLFLAFLHFFRVSLTYYAAVLGLVQLFRLRTYVPLVPVVGMILVVMSVTSFDNAMEAAAWGENLAGTYSACFEIILPLFTLLTALFRKLDIRKGENPCQL